MESEMKRAYANRIVREFEAYVEQDAMAGAGHPDLIEWHAERLAIARERLIRRLMGGPWPTLRMPEPPDVRY
jgi:hypothetical protein